MMNQQDAKRLFGSERGEKPIKPIHLALSQPSRCHQRRRRHGRGHADKGKRAAAAQRRKDCAAGRIVSESGKFTGTIAHDVTRSVGDALREVERALSDLDDKVPHEVRDRFSRLGRKISDAVERAVEEARERRRDRTRPREDAAPESASSSAASSEEPPVPGSEGTRDDAIMKILNAVREGTLKPDEADRLIAAWAELHRASPDSRSE